MYASLQLPPVRICAFGIVTALARTWRHFSGTHLWTTPPPHDLYPALSPLRIRFPGSLHRSLHLSPFSRFPISPDCVSTSTEVRLTPAVHSQYLLPVSNQVTPSTCSTFSPKVRFGLSVLCTDHRNFTFSFLALFCLLLSLPSPVASRVGSSVGQEHVTLRGQWK
jgi:hypothetical protein